MHASLLSMYFFALSHFQGDVSLMAEQDWLDNETQMWGLPHFGICRELKGWLQSF